MSYILDALRRSQAERERAGVPGLDAQPTSMPSPGPVRRRAALTWAALGVVTGLLGAWALSSMRPQTSVAGPPSAIAPSTPPAADTVATAAAPTTSPAPALLAAPAPAPAQPLPMVVSARPAPHLPAAAALSGSAGAPAPPGVAAPKIAPGAPSSPAAPARAVALSQLSPEQRRDLPPLAIGGAIWSESVSNRFVIINGQLVREGEAPVPGLTLERIGPKALWLRWRDLRIEVPL